MKGFDNEILEADIYSGERVSLDTSGLPPHAFDVLNSLGEVIDHKEYAASSYSLGKAEVDMSKSMQEYPIGSVFRQGKPRLTINQITSSGLGRLYALMRNKAVVFVSAFRETRTLEENLALNGELKNNIRKHHLGFVPIIGEWGQQGEEKQFEHSFAVSGPGTPSKESLVSIGIQLVAPYDQQSIMVVSDEVAEFYNMKGELIDEKSRFQASMLDEWVETSWGVSRGKSTLVRGPAGRSFTFSSCGEYEDNFIGFPAFAKPAFMNTISQFAHPERRPTIRQRFLMSGGPDKLYGKHAVMALRELGMDLGSISSIISHWAVSKEVASAVGPRTLAEWKLYERANKMREGGFSYRDAVGILARDAGVMPKRVKDIIGTSEEWRLGYYDDGLKPLSPELEEMVKRDNKAMRDTEGKGVMADIVNSILREKEEALYNIPKEVKQLALSNLKVSSAAYQQIFSMAKIKKEDWQEVPEYLLRLFSPAMIDGWWGDSDRPDECTKFSCQLAVGHDQVFYFNFKRVGGHASMAESSMGKPFKFSSLLLHQNDSWYAKKNLTQGDFKTVFDVVVGNQVNDAVKILNMDVTTVMNPLDHV